MHMIGRPRFAPTEAHSLEKDIHIHWGVFKQVIRPEYGFASDVEMATPQN